MQFAVWHLAMCHGFPCHVCGRCRGWLGLILGQSLWYPFLSSIANSVTWLTQQIYIRRILTLTAHSFTSHYSTLTI